ncbi:MAG: hypothetical protein DHS20C13_26600 [Thermodesulfobacteriota bacterium]|nr:MAG: hypothetical protein DHS20C13_26600 [Thermodesulfobacteriota bacterium]
MQILVLVLKGTSISGLRIPLIVLVSLLIVRQPETIMALLLVMSVIEVSLIESLRDRTTSVLLPQ